MAVTVYFKTNKNAVSTKLGTEGWLAVDTTINQTPHERMYLTPEKSFKRSRVVDNYTRVYCHSSAAPEPTSDGYLKTTTFTASEVEYSGNGYIKSFTSATGIFTSDQSFDNLDTPWVVYYVSKRTNVTSGYSPYIRFEFYKRNSSNVDTSLFTVEGTTNAFYLGNGQSVDVYPSGSVTTSDRLRIRVYGNERIPT